MLEMVVVVEEERLSLINLRSFTDFGKREQQRIKDEA
jgi:hypothetical protein